MELIDVPKNTLITLTEYEQAIARYSAEHRTANNRRNKVRNNNFTNRPDQEIELQGFGAEMAFCKLFNSFPDFTIGVRSAKEDRGDCAVEGLRIDVKSNRNANGDLFVGINKHPTVYAYALMTGLFPQFTFRGFMLASEIMAKHRVAKMPGGLCFKAEQRELMTWDVLRCCDLGFEAINPFTRKTLASVS